MKKYLSLALTCVLIFGLLGIVQAQSNGDFVLVSEASVGGEPIEVSLSNDSDAAVTVSGIELHHVTVYPAGHPGHEPYPTWDSEALEDPDEDDVFLGGGAEVTIEPGQSGVIAVLAPGLPDTWRSFDTANHSLKINAGVRIDGVLHHLELDHTIVPKSALGYDLTLGTNSPTDPGDSIILELTNDSGVDVTIHGPAVVQGLGHWSTKDSSRMRFPLMGNAPIVIPAGDTVEIVEIEPGNPYTWLNFYSPKILDYLKVWVHVEGSSGDGLWQSETICHAIAGEQADPMLFGWVKFTSDNEDGTATLTAYVDHAHYTRVVTVEDGQCKDEHEVRIIEPATGLGKEHFQVLRISDGVTEVIGTVLSAREIEPGMYELVWSYENGDHTVFVEVTDPQTDWPSVLGTDYENYFDEDNPYSDTNFDVAISTVNKPIASVLNPSTGKYEGTLEYPSATLTFSDDSEITAEISFRRKGTTANPPPEGATSAGIYMDINVVSGELGDDCEITLEVKYSLADIPVGMNENDLKLFRFNEDSSEWELLPDQELDTDARVIRVKLQGFSEFGVFELAPGAGLPATGTNIYLAALYGMLLILGGIFLLRRSQIA